MLNAHWEKDIINLTIVECKSKQNQTDNLITINNKSNHSGM